jgi:hypothetical protein
VLLQPESKTTTHVHLQWESPKRSVPKVWNIKLHMPTGAIAFTYTHTSAHTTACACTYTCTRTYASRLLRRQ